MGFVTEDGLHEGYLVPQFLDGQRGAGVTGAGIAAGRVACAAPTEVEDGSWSQPTRPAGEVIGWVVCCDCHTAHSFRYTTWVGPVFARVPSKALEDLTALRIYAPDNEVAYVAERADVEEAARDLWRSEHAFSTDALTEVETATRAATEARQRLDAAVAFARHGGASWAAIGRAAGMTRQSAQERWRTLDGSSR